MAYGIDVESVNATELKNRLGAVLERSALAPVAIVRHGRVVAYLVPAAARNARAPADRARRGDYRWSRREEERIVELCARGDFRPSRWLRSGDSRILGGVATMLASHSAFDRNRMLALAERLDPGISSPGRFGRWLRSSPVQATRFMAVLSARMKEANLDAPR